MLYSMAETKKLQKKCEIFGGFKKGINFAPVLWLLLKKTREVMRPGDMRNGMAAIELKM